MGLGVTLIILLLMGLGGKTLQLNEQVDNYEDCGKPKCEKVNNSLATIE